MSQTIPLSVPEELLNEVRETAKATNLSVQDVFRQSTKLGMPTLRAALGGAAGKVRRPNRLSLWDALASGHRLNVEFPTLAKDKVRKIEL